MRVQVLVGLGASLDPLREGGFVKAVPPPEDVTARLRAPRGEKVSIDGNR